MYNKVLIPLLLCFFSLSQISYGQTLWYTQNSDSNRELTDVCFVDLNNGWVSGWTGTMLHTTDGGQNRTPQTVPPNNAYYSVYFKDLQNGWATGYQGKLIHTSDGGENWVSQTSPVSIDIYSIYFIDSNTGWAVGHPGTVAATDNSTPVELTSFSASVDNGNVTLNWKTATEINNSGFEIQRSEVRSQELEWNKIGFTSGFCSSTEEHSYSFVDEGLQPGNYLYKLMQVDYDGTRNESEAINVEVNMNPSQFNLSQNYSNPFNPATVIQYSVPVNGNVKFTVFNSVGEVQKVLVNEYEQAGNHNIDFNAEELASGVYFYQLNANNFSSIKKMILLK